jgi:DNA-binding MarR family transcriptional regulator
MNNSRSADFEAQKSLQILRELSDNDSLTQRDLSLRLDIALGLVNSYIKNLISKGFITVKSIHPRRYAYFLTPNGLAEKTRLTYHLLQDYTRIYREAKSGFRELFSKLRSLGVKRIAFAGADEVAEIAYITLHETDLELAGIVDEELAGRLFFSRDISPIGDLGKMDFDCIVITSYLKRESIYRALLDMKIPMDRIKTVFFVSIEK